MDDAFEDWFEATLRSSARESVLTYKDDPRSHRGALRGAN